MSKKLAIAMFGQKRLSREGGVEIVVKELCTRMAQNGCDVTCYNRAGHHVSGAEYDDTIIPFKDKFDTSLKLYGLMTTKPNEMGKHKEKKEA